MVAAFRRVAGAESEVAHPLMHQHLMWEAIRVLSTLTLPRLRAFHMVQFIALNIPDFVTLVSYLQHHENHHSLVKGDLLATTVWGRQPPGCLSF